ncbi:hypothetical protein GCM10007036_10530 [Alsobacter metallidurans]|uniref:Uncharacterized protein n=1 Tax=Alsobacter metallidurans TaxID=340221 RepID=A0A917MG33_9HYPH|nr:hypothetical protein GCM10007036_10530 [Alsobacter metallidurans]
MPPANDPRVSGFVAQLPTLLEGEGVDLGDIPAGQWTVQDSDSMNSPGYALACVYYADRRAGDLTWDEARRISAGIARLPLTLRPSTIQPS